MLDEDDRLVKEIAKGSQKAFRSLFEKYSGALLGYCQRLLANQSLAEEVSQEVWMKVVTLAESYKAESHFSAWLFTMARNTCFNQLKRQNTTFKYSEELAYQGELKQTEQQMEKMFEEKEDQNLVKKAIDSLPDSQRVALILRIADELSYEEIAGEMRLSLSAVKSLIFRAKQSLEKSLSN